VRRLAGLPAANLGLKDRGRIAAGAYADLVIFDPATVADRATYAEPHQYATGVRDVVLNGRVTLRDGRHTGVLAGRAIGRGRAPGRP
jgi:N-acyl-D-amino-acid deacylase